VLLFVSHTNIEINGGRHLHRISSCCHSLIRATAHTCVTSHVTVSLLTNYCSSWQQAVRSGSFYSPHSRLFYSEAEDLAWLQRTMSFTEGHRMFQRFTWLFGCSRLQDWNGPDRLAGRAYHERRNHTTIGYESPPTGIC
jgi:hypothetical protein